MLCIAHDGKPADYELFRVSRIKFNETPRGAGDTATLLFVSAAHEITNATFYKNRQVVYFQATCRMYHVIFPCAARMNNNVAVLLVTKLPHVWSA